MGPSHKTQNDGPRLRGRERRQEESGSQERWRRGACLLWRLQTGRCLALKRVNSMLTAS